MKTFEQKFIDYVVQLYKEEQLSITLIANLTEISKYHITNILKSLNVLIVNRLNQLNYDIEKDIIPLYNQGMSLTKIAAQFNTNRDTLSRHLKKLGYEVINRQNLTKFNENIFDSIDTEEKAYWLGFIYADGYIDYSPLDLDKKSRYAFELSLKATDVEHLNKFNTFMQHNKDNVKVGKTKCNNVTCYRCRWSVVNKHLWETLNSYGCTPRKSLTLEFPNENIFKDKSLIRHFIRGYFDGDGYFSRIKCNDKVYPYCGFLGTLSMLINILNIIKQYGITVAPIRKANKEGDDRCLLFNLSQENSKKLINYLYTDSSIYLNRKYNLFKFFKNGGRSVEELTELLEGNIDEGCDADIEINTETKESVVS